MKDLLIKNKLDYFIWFVWIISTLLFLNYFIQERLYLVVLVLCVFMFRWSDKVNKNN